MLCVRKTRSINRDKGIIRNPSALPANKTKGKRARVYWDMETRLGLCFGSSCVSIYAYIVGGYCIEPRLGLLFIDDVMIGYSRAREIMMMMCCCEA